MTVCPALRRICGVPNMTGRHGQSSATIRVPLRKVMRFKVRCSGLLSGNGTETAAATCWTKCLEKCETFKACRNCAALAVRSCRICAILRNRLIVNPSAQRNWQWLEDGRYKCRCWRICTAMFITRRWPTGKASATNETFQLEITRKQYYYTRQLGTRLYSFLRSSGHQLIVKIWWFNKQNFRCHWNDDINSCYNLKDISMNNWRK